MSLISRECLLMWRDRIRLVVAAVCLGFGVLVFGCAHESAEEPARAASVPAAEGAPRYVLGFEAQGDGEGVLPVRLTSVAEGLNRKIIYNATVELALEEFGGVPDRVFELVKKFDTYVADSSLSGSSGENL